MQALQTIINKLETLKAISSNNERKEHLKKLMQADDDSVAVIRFLLNRNIVTHIAKSKLNKTITAEPAIDIKSFGQLLTELSTNANGTDEFVKSVQDFVAKVKPENQQFVKDIVTKSYTTHINVTTFNKIADELNQPLLPDFKVQLAINIDKLSDRLAKKPELLGDFYVTEKFDGVRTLAVIIDNNVTLYARSGKVIPNVTEVESELTSLKLGNRIFDGELLISHSVNTGDLAEDDFRQTTAITSAKGEKLGLTYHIFDTLTSPTRFYTQDARKPYSERRQWLDKHESMINAKPHLNVVTALYHGSDIKQAMRLRDEIVANGGEGVMLNLSDAIYEFKRTNKLLKIKQLSENDGVITGVYEGEGENAGKLGGVNITYKDTIVNIGTGFTQQERVNYWQHPDQIIGKVGTYKFTTESKNQNGDINLRFGRWKGLRFDKTADDVSYDN